jgi:DNA modification methylase
VRIERVGEAVLYLADCRAVLPALGRVDVLITDPPYEIGDGWSGGGFNGRNGSGRHWNEKAPSWDVICQDGISAALSLADGGVVWGGHLYQLPASSGWLAWDKVQSFSSSDFELAWCSRQGATRAFRMSRIDAHQNSGEKKEHPTQKPTALMLWCLQFFPEARSVLDPFMGSGTTGVAAVKLGRRFIGVEREPKYFEIAVRRIEAAYAQPDLFVRAPEPKPEQLSLLGATE